MCRTAYSERIFFIFKYHLNYTLILLLHLVHTTTSNLYVTTLICIFTVYSLTVLEERVQTGFALCLYSNHVTASAKISQRKPFAYNVIALCGAHKAWEPHHSTSTQLQCHSIVTKCITPFSTYMLDG